MAKICTDPINPDLIIDIERPKTLAIIGSRDIQNGLEVFNLIINEVRFYLPYGFWPDLIIHGGAKGVDTIAECVANRLKIKDEAITPNYANFGKAAPIIRNREIIDRADYVLAFWNWKSRGTKWGIEYARSKNKRIKVIPID